MIKERLISALIGIMFFVIFLPFGLDNFGWNRWFLLAGLALVISLACLVSEYILRLVLRMPHDTERGMNYIMRRNFFYQIINFILLVSGTVAYLHFFVNNETVDNHFSQFVVLKVAGIMAAVLFIIGMYWRNVYWRRHYEHELSETQRINGMLEERRRQMTVATTAVDEAEVEMEEEKPITLSGTTKESVTLLASDFLYAESEGNYVHVYYIKEERVSSTMIRASFKDVEEQMKSASSNGWESAIRCHRAFIVNLKQVSKVVGRASGLMLVINNTDNQIPVSKTYSSEIRNRLENL